MHYKSLIALWEVEKDFGCEKSWGDGGALSIEFQIIEIFIIFLNDFIGKYTTLSWCDFWNHFCLFTVYKLI